MKKLLFLSLLLHSLFSFANETSIELGTGLSMGTEVLQGDYIILKSFGVVETSVSKYTTMLPGCYSSKQATGENFPYNYVYRPQLSSQSFETDIRDNSIILNNENVNKLINATRLNLKEKTPFHCGSTTTVFIYVDINIDGEVFMAHVRVKKDGENFYPLSLVDSKPLKNKPVNFIFSK